jgi:ubiquinone/menaquinone biosynthesis C-methylase UbiE
MLNIHGTKYTDINSRVISGWVANGWIWGKPISHETYRKAQNGDWNVLLSGSKYVPKSWFPDLKGKKLLGLACGGGQQMPVFCALGADCTVLDYSDAMLENENMVARREGYAIHIVKADMTERFPFENNTFDIIFHPVSNCYVEDVYHVWNECYRVLKNDGICMAGMDNGMAFLFNDISDYTQPLTVVHTMPFNPLKNKDVYDTKDGIQFSHTLEEQIGGQLKAGFILTDLYEDMDESGLLHDYNIPQYIVTRAVKRDCREQRT